jgi:hypothetical protein
MFIRIARMVAYGLIAALAAVAIGSGIGGMIGGPSGPAGDAAVESNYRFLSAFLLAAGVVLAWCLFRFRTATVPLRVVCATVLAGGIARLFAIPDTGAPDAAYTAFIIAEIAGPLAIVALHAVVTGGRFGSTRVG